MHYVNLRFFKGDAETITTRKRDPEDPKLTSLRNQIYGSLGAVFNGDNYARDYAQAKNRANTALGYYDQTAKNYNDVVNTGVLPSAIADNMNKSINRELNLNTGSALSDLAARGVLNSSVTNRSMNNLADSAANAYAQNYLNAYDTVTGKLNTAMGAYADMPGAMYDNVSAAYKDPYTFWKDWQTIYSGSEDYDTAVVSGGK